MDAKYHVTPYLNDKRFAAAYFQFLNLAKEYKETPPASLQNMLNALKAFSKGERIADVLATHVVAKAN